MRGTGGRKGRGEGRLERGRGGRDHAVGVEWDEVELIAVDADRREDRVEAFEWCVGGAGEGSLLVRWETHD